jgi:hypothetical protein
MRFCFQAEPLLFTCSVILSRRNLLRNDDLALDRRIACWYGLKTSDATDRLVKVVPQ